MNTTHLKKICTTMAKRTVAYIIDYLSISVILLVLCTMIGSFLYVGAPEDTLALMTSFVYWPHVFWPNLVMHPDLHGCILWLPIVVFVDILAESLIYSIQERAKGRTAGKWAIGLMMDHPDHQNMSFVRLFFRNLLKVSSKYLFGLPFFWGCFVRRNRTFYDRLTGIAVFEEPS